MVDIKLKPIRDQVVVIMGASSGIGRETALQFAKKCAKVVVSSRDIDALNNLVDIIIGNGGDAMAIDADTSIYNEVRMVATEAVQRYGRIDSWVQAAATPLYARFEDTEPDEFRRIIEVNLVGQAYGAMAALPYMRDRGGALIHISSVEAEVGLPYQSAYAASKHGIKGMLDVIRMEFQHDRVPISVTNIMPSGINTPFFNHARSKLGVKPRPTKPVYEPDIVAGAILYAAEHPVPELVVGGGGQVIVWGKRFLPRLTDALIMRRAFTGQLTQERVGPNAEDNMYYAMANDNRIRGDFEKEARHISMQTWWNTHPMARKTVKSALVVSAGYMAGKKMLKVA